MVFLFYMALWFILRGASCFKVFPCSLSSCFVIPFSIVITWLEEEGAGLYASHAFVCLFCFCHLSLPLGVGSWLLLTFCISWLIIFILTMESCWLLGFDKRDDFNFPIVNFPFLSSIIPSAPAYGVYVSQLILYLHKI